MLLALDNFSGHKFGVDLCEDNFTNMYILWLPPNCTSIVLPVDQGIGATFNAHYRKYLHEFQGRMLITGKDPKKELVVLLACQWIGQALNSLNGPRTVMRCFEKAGFRHEKAAPVVDEEAQLHADKALVTNPNTVADIEVIVDELIAEETKTNLESQERLEEKAPQIEESETSAPCLSITEAFETMVELGSSFTKACWTRFRGCRTRRSKFVG